MDTKELREFIKGVIVSNTSVSSIVAHHMTQSILKKIESKLTQPQQTINLAELEDKLDKALDGETPESLKQWLSEQRQQQKKYTDMDNETSDVLWHELRIYCKKHYGIPWDKMWQDVGGAVLWRCLSGFLLNYKNRVEDLESRITHLRSQLSNAIAEQDKLQPQTNDGELIELCKQIYMEWNNWQLEPKNFKDAPRLYNLFDRLKASLESIQSPTKH